MCKSKSITCHSLSRTVPRLSKRAEECKSAGNHAYFEKDFARAVRLYSQAIHYAPQSALLYSNRSAALLGRSWEGDAWYALQDAEQALRMNPSSSKAFYRRIQALRALGQLEVHRPSPLLQCCILWALLTHMLKNASMYT